MEPPDVSTKSKQRSKTTRLLFGCLGGCGLLSLMLVSSCVGFVWWLNRPGQLIVPADLRGEDTTAYVEWTLRLEDPGTLALVEGMFAGLREIQEKADTPLPPGVETFLLDYQNSRNERQFRELFPCVVAWSVVGDEREGEELHLFTVSIEKMGNRIVFVDWMMGMFIGRSPELDVVGYEGEKIYVLDNGLAFFMRRSDFILTTDLDTARRAVDRLQPDRIETGQPTGLERLLDRLPADRRLRGAALNGHDEVRRFFDMLTGQNERELIDRLDWSDISGMTVAGGFTESSAFSARIDLLMDESDWSEADLAALRHAVGQSVSSDGLPTRVEIEALPNRVELRFEVDDLPGLMRHRVALEED